MKQVSFATARLALREVAPDDVEAFFRLDRDPEVMRYIGDGSVGTRAAAAAAVARTAKYYALYPGLGKWCAEDSSERFIGWFSLNYVPKTVEVEVGYRLLPDAWGRGFATEGARALLDHGFRTLGLYRIIGLTHPDNAASQRVLQKAGLRDAGWGRYYERKLRVFVAERR
ncbi:MAG TPA: GNAT family N-acetyltransferase [Casimicrobiaceae bacterium]|nr:GNAT family N-acetyltransferase [Casimicrobiaceae bacterium]